MWVVQDEETALPKLFYSKVRMTRISFSGTDLLVFLSFRRILLPDMFSSSIQCSVLSSRKLTPLHHVDFLSATGGSAIKAVEVLMEHGVPLERIIFINLVCLSFSLLSKIVGNLVE